jgi:hypothetical protein
MTNHNRYTSGAIAEILCEADGMALDSASLHRVRNLARSAEILQNPREIDGRGTKDFPALEVYRARLFSTLVQVGVQSPVLVQVSEAGLLFPAGGKASRGAFRDSIAAAANGEAWELVIAHFPPLPVDLPGFVEGDTLYIRFAMVGSTESVAFRSVDQKKPHAVTRVDLSALWAGILPVVGIPA